MRKFPVVTEVCVHYVKAARFKIGDQSLSMQDWLRYEWQRTGLPFNLANEACGVLNAATRKYLTADHLWCYPSVDAFVKLAQYANEHGDPDGRSYFSVDGKQPIPANQWARQRAKFTCEVGVTNVWRQPQVAGAERIQGTRNGMKYKFSSLHGSQKPIKLINLIVRTATDQGDNEVHLCGIKTQYWRQFLKAFQESTTDVEARTALERLRQKVRRTTDIPSPRAQSALAILAELERLLDLSE